MYKDLIKQPVRVFRASLRGVQGIAAFLANIKEEKPALSSSHDLFKAKVISSFLKDDSSILDVGCGNGRRLMDLSLFIRNLKCTGIEINTVKKSRYPDCLKSDIELLVFDGLEIPFEDKSFDFVTICYVLHHLSDKHADHLLNEAIRVGKDKIILLEDSMPHFSLFYQIRNWAHATEANLEYSFKSKNFKNNFNHTMFKSHSEWNSYLRNFKQIIDVEVIPIDSISKNKHHTMIVCNLVKT